MNNGSCEFESHLGHQKVVGATALATFSFYPAMPIPKVGVEGEVDTMTDPLRGSCCCGISGKFVGINYALLPNCEWNQKQKHKKQPWSNVECFAFGGATVRFASLETSFHAANHTIPPPPSHEGSPHCPKDKNLSPFHGEKPLVKE